MWRSDFLVAVRGTRFPDQGSNPGPLHWEHGVLPTRPSGRSPTLLNGWEKPVVRGMGKCPGIHPLASLNEPRCWCQAWASLPPPTAEASTATETTRLPRLKQSLPSPLTRVLGHMEGLEVGSPSTHCRLLV